MFGFCLAATISLGICLFLLVKCYRKRNASGKMKDQMQIKRHQYATALGLTVQQLNMQFNYPTVHV